MEQKILGLHPWVQWLFFVNADGAKGLEFAGGAKFVISIFGLGFIKNKG